MSLSEDFRDAIDLMDDIQGTKSIVRKLERHILSRLKGEELRAIIAPDENDLPADPKARWKKDVDCLVDLLIPTGGSFECFDLRYGYILKNNPKIIANELQNKGYYWATHHHVKAAQRQINYPVSGVPNGLSTLPQMA